MVTFKSRVLAFIFWGGLFPNLLQAQDTNFVKKYNNLVNLKTFVYNNGLDFWNKGSGLNYIPGIHSGIGFGAYCKYLPFDFSIRQELSFLDNNRHYHKRKATDMQLKGYVGRFAGDIFIQNYQGFYTREASSYKYLYKGGEEDEENLTFEPDLNVFQFEASGKYIFNHDKFSYKAGVTAYERQLKSAGSLIAGMSFHYLKINSDSSLVNINNSEYLSASNFGINGGYAYNYVFGKRSTLFCSTMMGVNLSNPLYKSVSYNDFKVSAAFRFQLAYWVNFDKWTLGLTSMYSIIHQTFTKNTTIFVHTRKMELLLIRRLCYKNGKEK